MTRGSGNFLHYSPNNCSVFLFFLGHRRNFRYISADVLDTLGVDYDYHSNMHYFAGEYSKNDKYTMTAIDDPLNTKLIGPNAASPWGLTALDIDKVNALYSCSPSKYR